MIHSILKQKLITINLMQSIQLYLVLCFGGLKKVLVITWCGYDISGYAGGDHPDPTYELVCSGLTGHAEVVKVDYDPRQILLIDLLKVFGSVTIPLRG